MASTEKEEKMQEIQEKLENGVREIFSTEKYRQFLTAMSKFRTYSVNNCILIASQNPNATLVCGFKKWQTEFQRTVNKGEHGIVIMMPIKRKIKVMEAVRDEYGNVVLNSDGTEKKEVSNREYMSFMATHVFDVSQTSGKPLPSIVTKLTADVGNYSSIKEALIEISPVPIYFESISEGANGYYHPTKRQIAIDQDLSQLQTIKTMVHEIAHATLHHGTYADKWDRRTKEVQAESIAYWVTQMMGLDTSEYSFGYISSWSRDKDVSELKENLELIKTTADQLSSDFFLKLQEKEELLDQRTKSEESVRRVLSRRR